jgi:hypothetical protein
MVHATEHEHAIEGVAAQGQHRGVPLGEAKPAAAVLGPRGFQHWNRYINADASLDPVLQKVEGFATATTDLRSRSYRARQHARQEGAVEGTHILLSMRIAEIGQVGLGDPVVMCFLPSPFLGDRVACEEWQAR